MERVNGHVLEFLEVPHIYIIDGIIKPSITQIIKYKFAGKYKGVDAATLRRAADAGTAMHAAIEGLCELERQTGQLLTSKDLAEDSPPELRNFIFLRKKYNFEVEQNEVPVILEDKTGEIIAAGRLDLVLKMGDEIGGADIKRTATLDKEYLALQLNLYRIAYRQCYGIEWSFLRGVHLREDKRRFVEIPIKEEYTWQFIEEWKQHANI